MKCRYIVFLISVAVSLGVSACGSNREGQSEEEPRASVRVARTTRGTIADYVEATGSFRLLRDETIRSPLAGSVVRLAVLEGDRVKRGALVASILSKESEAAISGAGELLRRAESEQERERAVNALELARRSASAANITAPFDGVVNARFVNEGAYVGEGDKLVELADPASAYFLADVPLERVSSIRRGERVFIRIPRLDRVPLRGSVTAINPSADPNSQTSQVRVVLSSVPPLARGGTFGTARILIGEHQHALLVPKDAVYHDDELDRYFAIRVQGDTLALLTQVQVGLADSSRIEITAGLTEGDVVATAGGYGLPDSTRVRIGDGTELTGQ